MQATANVNGLITPLADAKISVLDRGFQYGDSIYEVIRTYEGVPFFLEEHHDRLENSARLSRIRLTLSREELTAEIRRTVQAAGLRPGEDAFVRYTITRGIGPLDLDPAVATKNSFVILVKEIPAWKKEHYERGMVLAVPSVLRNSPQSLDPNIKSGNYLNNILAVAEAKELGGDDALLISPDGKLTEASNSNVAFVINGELRTPLHEPRTHTGNLRGITRTLIGELCANVNVPYSEVPMLPADAERASECFVSSATREIMPVCSVILAPGQRKEFPAGGGPITRKLQGAYGDFVKQYVASRKKEAWF
jgi:branched-chain amino acid aminotransferase